MKRALRRLLYGKPVIVVSGLPRSGTSMLMQMLERGGVPIVTDQIRQPDEDNPRGYHELERVKELDKTVDKAWVRNHRGEAMKVISFLLRELPTDVNYRVLFMRRDLDEALRSQNKMLERNNENGGVASDEKMRRNYEGHLRSVYYNLDRQPHYERLYLDYHAVVEDVRTHAERINQFLGGGLNVEAMTQAVDPNLYRNRQTKGSNA